MKWSFVVAPLIGLALVSWWALFAVDAAQAKGAGKPATVVVEFYYRSRTFNDGRLDPIRSERQKITIDVPLKPGDMADQVKRIELPAKDPQYEVKVTAEAKSLLVEIINSHTKRPIADSQFAISESTADQFYGNHGFSGLSYVRHPDNDAELQFWCQRPAVKSRLLPSFGDLFGGEE